MPQPDRLDELEHRVRETRPDQHVESAFPEVDDPLELGHEEAVRRALGGVGGDAVERVQEPPRWKALSWKAPQGNAPRSC